MSARRTYPAPAKLNLMLRVVGQRADGYHLLQTVFRFIDLNDDVTLSARADGVIARKRDVPGVAPESDLALRAARLLKAATGTRLGADIDLVKRIPMGAGLGGGSSDAATVLLGLNALWGTGCTRAMLAGLALELGADVPAFVHGESAFGEGIGERLTPIPLPPAWYVVLTPPVAVSTPAVFAHPDLKRDSKPIKIQGFSIGSPKVAVNDLESLVCRLHPDVARYLEWLRHHAPALMTGSGSAVFAAFETEGAAQQVLAALPAGMKGFVARGLDRHPLRDLA